MCPPFLQLEQTYTNVCSLCLVNQQLYVRGLTMHIRTGLKYGNSKRTEYWHPHFLSILRWSTRVLLDLSDRNHYCRTFDQRSSIINAIIRKLTGTWNLSVCMATSDHCCLPASAYCMHEVICPSSLGMDSQVIDLLQNALCEKFVTYLDTQHNLSTFV